MRCILIIATVLLLVSCHRHIAPTASSVESLFDTVQIETFYHDTVINWKPLKTVVHDTIPCPALDYDKVEKNDGQEVEIKAHDGILDVTCKTDSLNQVIRVLSQKLSEKSVARKDSTIVITKEVKVPVTKWPRILWWSLGLNAVSLFGLFMKFKPGITSVVGPIISLIQKFKK